MDEMVAPSGAGIELSHHRTTQVEEQQPNLFQGDPCTKLPFLGLSKSVSRRCDLPETAPDDEPSPESSSNTIDVASFLPITHKGRSDPQASDHQMQYSSRNNIHPTPTAAFIAHPTDSNLHFVECESVTDECRSCSTQSMVAGACETNAADSTSDGNYSSELREKLHRTINSIKEKERWLIGDSSNNTNRSTNNATVSCEGGNVRALADRLLNDMGRWTAANLPWTPANRSNSIWWAEEETPCLGGGTSPRTYRGYSASMRNESGRVGGENLTHFEKDQKRKWFYATQRFRSDGGKDRGASVWDLRSNLHSISDLDLASSRRFSGSGGDSGRPPLPFSRTGSLRPGMRLQVPGSTITEGTSTDHSYQDRDGGSVISLLGDTAACLSSKQGGIGRTTARNFLLLQPATGVVSPSRSMDTLLGGEDGGDKKWNRKYSLPRHHQRPRPSDRPASDTEGGGSGGSQTASPEGGGDRVQGWAASFERLLEDPAGLHTFAEFLRKEYSHENIFFWTACERYRQGISSSDPSSSGGGAAKEQSSSGGSSPRPWCQWLGRHAAAAAIYNTHLGANAPEPVNVDSQARQVAQEGLHEPSEDLFAAAQKQVFNLMKFDSYSRFLKSALYQECVERETRGEGVQFTGEDDLDPSLRIHDHSQPLTQRHLAETAAAVNNNNVRLPSVSGHSDRKASTSKLVRTTYDGGTERDHSSFSKNKGRKGMSHAVWYHGDGDEGRCDAVSGNSDATTKASGGYTKSTKQPIGTRSVVSIKSGAVMEDGLEPVPCKTSFGGFDDIVQAEKSKSKRGNGISLTDTDNKQNQSLVLYNEKVNSKFSTMYDGVEGENRWNVPFLNSKMDTSSIIPNKVTVLTTNPSAATLKSLPVNIDTNVVAELASTNGLIGITGSQSSLYDSQNKDHDAEQATLPVVPFRKLGKLATADVQTDFFGKYVLKPSAVEGIQRSANCHKKFSLRSKAVVESEQFVDDDNNLKSEMSLNLNESVPQIEERGMQVRNDVHETVDGLESLNNRPELKDFLSSMFQSVTQDLQKLTVDNRSSVGDSSDETSRSPPFKIPIPGDLVRSGSDSKASIDDSSVLENADSKSSLVQYDSLGLTIPDEELIQHLIDSNSPKSVSSNRGLCKTKSVPFDRRISLESTSSRSSKNSYTSLTTPRVKWKKFFHTVRHKKNEIYAHGASSLQQINDSDKGGEEQKESKTRLPMFLGPPRFFQLRPHSFHEDDSYRDSKQATIPATQVAHSVLSRSPSFSTKPIAHLLTKEPQAAPAPSIHQPPPPLCPYLTVMQRERSFFVTKKNYDFGEMPSILRQ